MVLSASISGRDFRGRVFLKDTTTVPGDYVMVYCQAIGTGTLTDEQGNFHLELGNLPGDVRVEFSRIGYRTAYRDIPESSDTIHIEDIILEPQELMLTAAYVTPEGMDPSKFILSKM